MVILGETRKRRKLLHWLIFGRKSTWVIHKVKGSERGSEEEGIHLKKHSGFHTRKAHLVAESKAGG